MRPLLQDTGSQDTAGAEGPVHGMEVVSQLLDQPESVWKELVSGRRSTGASGTTANALEDQEASIQQAVSMLINNCAVLLYSRMSFGSGSSATCSTGTCRSRPA